MNSSVFLPFNDKLHRCLIVLVIVLSGHTLSSQPAPADDDKKPLSAEVNSPSDFEYDRKVGPLLEQYCAGCHADGASEGDFTLETLSSTDASTHDTQAWWTVLKNVRSDVMPPDGEDQPTDAEKEMLSRWIAQNVFSTGRDPLDPGPLVLRRLNRIEYRNTVRDLMGVNFDTSVEFPPDDTGDGFDNNADALSISPLLAEKYVEAASKIVEQAVPTTSRVMPVRELAAKDFKTDPESKTRRLSLEKAGSAIVKFQIDTDASYRIVVPVNVRGSFDFHPARARLQLLLDGNMLHEDEYGWNTDLKNDVSVERRLEKGEHTLKLVLSPIEDPQSNDQQTIEAETFVRLQIQPARVEGPLSPRFWDKPRGYERFFPLDDPPADTAEQNKYAKQILEKFCLRAYRHPVKAAHLERLLEFAGFSISDETTVDQALVARVGFEQCIAKAMTAVLASPRFLFRVDQPQIDSGDLYPQVNDYSLASRLSFLLWSTMPDEELFRLAQQGTLKANLSQQVDRMLNDEKSEHLVKNFVGQWLQTRDVESVTIDPLAALGFREEYEELTVFLDAIPSGRRTPPADAPAEHHAAKERYSELRRMKFLLESDLRQDMGRETEKLFEYVLNNNRPLKELLDADYAFVNERLAKHYGMSGIKGNKIRKVPLPKGSPRGGILTQGTFLIVTSNPSRTSPVKRGLFILDNILGTPAPPAPPMVPELEEAASKHSDEEPTLRQLLELHRQEPLCNSCHARFDPLGLAFENFTAIGTWRDTENNRPIEPGGQLISGESFGNVNELKRVLVGPRRADFYRCLSERMLAYAIGRSLDFGDENALEQITDQLADQDGGAQTLVKGVIESAPFLRMRRPEQQLSSMK